MTEQNPRVLLGLSGGMASAVAASLLKAQGFDVTGVYLRSQQQEPAHCLNRDRRAQVEKICKKLDFTFEEVDVTDLIDAYLVDPFLHRVLRGKADDPCLNCHARFKTEYLFAYAHQIGVDFVATGHFAQLIRDLKTQTMRLKRAVDPTIDQAFFLSRLRQSQLQHLICPLGGLTLTQVERLAYQLDLPQAEAPCSVRREDWLKIIPHRTTPDIVKPGPIRTVESLQIGSHPGIYRAAFRGLEGLQFHAKEQRPYFVQSLDEQEPAVIVSESPALTAQEFTIHGVNWLQPQHAWRDRLCEFQIYKQSKTVKARVSYYEPQGARVVVEAPLAPNWAGEFVLFSEGDEILGSGWIAQSEI